MALDALPFDDSAKDEAIEDSDGELASDATSNVEPAKVLGVNTPKRLNRDEGLEWVLRVLQRSRGRELPGNFNPMLISQLFWEQSEPWEMLAKAHISAVASVCSKFVEDVLETAASKEVKPRLWTLKIEAALKASLDAAQEELKKLIQDKGRHPITYNHYYTTTIQKARSKKYRDKLLSSASKANTLVKTRYEGMVNYVDPSTLGKKLGDDIELDMDKFSAEEALDSQSAYYKVSHPASSTFG